MSSLVLAEKPSVAKSIADVLGAKTRKPQYYGLRPEQQGGSCLFSICKGGVRP